MPSSPADLMSEIYTFFRVLYPANSPQAFLAFEPTGFPINPDDFLFNGASCPPLAVEWVSHLANRAITFNKGNMQRGSTVVDSFIQLMVDGCRANTPDDMTLVGAEKLAAEVQIGITEASLSGIPDDDYHPVTASPVNWYDATQGANWARYTAGQPPATTAPPPPKVPIVPPPIVWKLGPPRRVLPIVINHGGGGGGPVVSPGHGPVHMMPMMMREATVAPVVSSAVLAQHPIALRPGEPAALAIEAPARLAMLSATLAQSATDVKATTTQSVATTNISLQCDYCMVSLDWPWLPQSFLMARNWYVPGYAQGAFSNGSGAQDTGFMPVTPSGFLLVRELSITAQWTGTDVSNLQSAAGLGPFSLAGSSFQASTGTLSCPGMQIVAWFCSALPVLPPSGDPLLQPATAGTTGTGAATSPPATAVAQPALP